MKAAHKCSVRWLLEHPQHNVHLALTKVIDVAEQKTVLYTLSQRGWRELEFS